MSISRLLLCGLACIACFMWGMAVHQNDQRLLAAYDTHMARLACGTGAELARLSDGFACLHETPEGRLVARPVFDSPVQIAGRSAGH